MEIEGCGAARYEHVDATAEADFLGWAWRVPFLVSILLAGVGLYIRLQLQETPVFRELKAENKVLKLPVIEVLTKQPRAFFTAIGLKLSEISYALIAGVFAINYVTVRLAMPRSVILNAVFASSVVALFAIPLFGLISDRIGRRAMFYAGTVFAMAFAFPFFWLFRVPVLLAVGHEGPDHHHTDDCRRHLLRADDRLRRRCAMVHGTFRGPDTLQRRFARLPDRRRHQWGSHAICGGGLLVMDERRHVANLDIPDRARRRHALRNDRRP